MDKMLAAVFHQNKDKTGGSINLEEVSIPKIENEDEVLIEIAACGICGTDIKIVEGGHPANDNTILGHEFAGIIKKKGKNISDLNIGDYVVVDPNEKCGYCEACRRGLENLCSFMDLGTTFGIFQNGGFTKFCKVPRKSLFKLPQSIDLTQAALVEPLSCAVHCKNIAKIKESDNIAIIGAGSMGLIIESVIRTYPLKNLIVIDLDDWRLQKAREIGADYIINPKQQKIATEIINITKNRGVDIIIDVVGIKDTFEMAQKIWAPGAKLICFGMDNRAQAQIKPNEIVRYQRQILGSYISNSADFLDAIQLISNKNIEVEKLITHKIKLEELITKGIPLMRERKCVKIITIP